MAKAKNKKYICETRCYINGHFYEPGAIALEEDLKLTGEKNKGKEKDGLKYFSPMKTTEDFVEPSSEDLAE